MKTRLTATKENREYLMKLFGVTERCVYNALSGARDNDLARRIRKAAKERGSLEIAVYDEYETMYDNDGYVRQYFPNGAMIEIEKATSTATIVHRGKTVMVKEVTFATISEVQDKAASLQN